ncbi:MAG: class I SAM-dependent methyltransferase [Nitrososphaerota archaeon]
MPGGGSGGGLGEEWGDVVKAIEALGPEYPSVNRVISLGLDRLVRMLGIGLSGVSGGMILDAGAGDGSLSMLIQERLGGRRCFIAMLDPSEKMLRLAKGRVRRLGSDAVVGLLEYAPFRNSSFHSAFMAFALRDVYSLTESVNRLASTLRQGAVFIVIDLAKPDSPFKREVLKLYWRIIAPLLTAMFLLKGWREISKIYSTYLLLPTEHELVQKLNRHFRLTKIKRMFFGGAHILVLQRLDTQVCVKRDIADRRE